VSEQRRCRVSSSAGELELAGPPDALRALGALLRRHESSVEVAVTGGSVAQEVTSGPLLVSLRDGSALHFSGARDLLDIVWHALDGVAEAAESAEDRHVNRHQHIEYYPEDEYRSPHSTPLTIVADWPDEPALR
jgi:hypothetical protein